MAKPTQFKYSGEATDSKDNIVYRESHVAIFDGDKILKSATEYLDTDGKKIATLDSDYSLNENLPVYEFADLRNNTREGVRLKDEKYEIYLMEKGVEKTIPLKDKDNTFAGQGWHYYFIKNLSVFEKQNVILKLILPGKLDVFTFAAKKTAAAGERLTVLMELNNWFLRMIAPSLKLTYDKPTKRLMVFEGVSNILDKNGKTQDVKITYKY